MTNVLIISTGQVIAASGDRVTIAAITAPVPKSVTGVSRILKVAKRRRAVKRARMQVVAAIEAVRPDAIVCDDWMSLEVLPATSAKVIALAHVRYEKDGMVKDVWRMRQYLTDIEATIVWHEDDRVALIKNEIYNVRVIEDSSNAWVEEVRQALR